MAGTVEVEGTVVEEAEVTGAATEADKVCYSLDNNMSWRRTFLLVGERGSYLYISYCLGGGVVDILPY